MTLFLIFFKTNSDYANLGIDKNHKQQKKYGLFHG